MHAHLNSIDMEVGGGKTIEFANDGGVITYSNPDDVFKGTLWGTLNH